MESNLPTTTLADRVKLLMRRQGIESVNELSRQSGVTLSALQRILNGSSRPRPATLRALGTFFGVTPSALLRDLGGRVSEKATFSSTAETLKHLLDDVCLSERELARLTGVSHAVINNIVSGATPNPSDASLHPLARFFSVSINQLRAREPLSPGRMKGESNEYLLRDFPIALVPWSDLALLPDALENDNLKKVFTTFSGSGLYATHAGSPGMVPLVHLGDLLICDYNRNFEDGKLFIVHHFRQGVVIGRIKYGTLHQNLIFSNTDFEKIRLTKGEYRKLGMIREICK
jgi:transcriptional regulator with XRE-family HTH domain